MRPFERQRAAIYPRYVPSHDRVPSVSGMTCILMTRHRLRCVVQVDMLVKDIYGGDYAKLGLPGNIVASDFGKISVRHALRDASAGEEPVHDEDLVRALMVLVLNNTAQVAYMTAKEHSVKRVYFVGNFLREGAMMRVLSSALSFWSGKEMVAGFMRHEGYFGAMGSLLAIREKIRRIQESRERKT